MNFNIYKNGELINTIFAAEEFTKAYCEENGYTYEKQIDPTSVEGRLNILEEQNAELTEAFNMILNGVTE